MTAPAVCGFEGLPDPSGATGMEDMDCFRGCLLGLAVGDAVGTAVEFLPRGSFPPIMDMAGGGPFGLNPGEWTDDNSMALCLATSLAQKGRFHAKDQMDRYRRCAETGHLSSNGRCFDIGGTVASALDLYRRTGNPFSGSTNPHSAGNGSIMRLAPVAIFYHPDAKAVDRFAAESSRTTHGTAECIDACRLLCAILRRALAGMDKEEVLLGDSGSFGGSPIAFCQSKRTATKGVREARRRARRSEASVASETGAACWREVGCEALHDPARDSLPGGRQGRPRCIPQD